MQSPQHFKVENKQQFKKVTFDFPAEEYRYLKMACAKQGVSMKEFLTKGIIKTIEDYEDNLTSIAFENYKNDEPGIPWEQVQKDLGWDKL